MAYNADKLASMKALILKINEASLQLEDLFSDWWPNISQELGQYGIVSEVTMITYNTQNWLDAIEATEKEPNNG